MGMTFFLYLNLIKLYNNHKKAIKRRKSVKEKIIEKLIKDLGNYVSGERLSEELGVTRTAIWKNINTLREEGYIIHSLPRKGYICLLYTSLTFNSTGFIKKLLSFIR